MIQSLMDPSEPLSRLADQYLCKICRLLHTFLPIVREGCEAY